MSTQTETQSGHSRFATVGVRIQSALLSLASLIALPLCYFVFQMFGETARQQGVELPALATTVLAYKLWVSLLTVPALILAILAAVTSRGRYLLLVLATLFLLAPVSMCIYLLIAVLGPMYTYQPL